nr:MFS transporter [Actinomadura rubrisoli]
METRTASLLDVLESDRPARERLWTVLERTAEADAGDPVGCLVVNTMVEMAPRDGERGRRPGGPQRDRGDGDDRDLTAGAAVCRPLSRACFELIHLKFWRRHPMPLAVFVLGLAIFAQGTSELMLAGLLPEMAADLGVSVPDAGLLISAFAIGMLVGAPVLAVLTLRWPHRRSLLAFWPRSP